MSTAVKIFIGFEMAVDDIFDSESDEKFNVLVLTLCLFPMFVCVCVLDCNIF